MQTVNIVIFCVQNAIKWCLMAKLLMNYVLSVGENDLFYLLYFMLFLHIYMKLLALISVRSSDTSTNRDDWKIMHIHNHILAFLFLLYLFLGV